MSTDIVLSVKTAWRIYLDVCCLNRPFDDQSQERIHLETEAVESILLHVERGDWCWVGSQAVQFEVQNRTDPERRSTVIRLLERVHEWISVGSRELRRVDELKAIGFKPMDALHIACSEGAHADVFLTTDDRLLRTARRQAEDLQVRVANPLPWLEEQIL
jgi:predicted nucleic acid-binding protein